MNSLHSRITFAFPHLLIYRCWILPLCSLFPPSPGTNETYYLSPSLYPFFFCSTYSLYTRITFVSHTSQLTFRVQYLPFCLFLRLKLIIHISSHLFFIYFLFLFHVFSLHSNFLRFSRLFPVKLFCTVSDFLPLPLPETNQTYHFSLFMYPSFFCSMYFHYATGTCTSNTPAVNLSSRLTSSEF